MAQDGGLVARFCENGNEPSSNLLIAERLSAFQGLCSMLLVIYLVVFVLFKWCSCLCFSTLVCHDNFNYLLFYYYFANEQDDSQNYACADDQERWRNLDYVNTYKLFFDHAGRFGSLP